MTPEQTDAFEKKIRAFIGTENSPTSVGKDKVNEPMIRHWAEIMEDDLGTYTDADYAASTSKGGLIAPPTMLQVWSMTGYSMADGSSDSQAATTVMDVFDEHGFTGVLGTNTSTEFYRDLRPGDEITTQSLVDSISEQKSTSRGVGYFIELATSFSDQNGDLVGKQLFRIFKFRPAEEGKPTAASTNKKDDGPHRMQPVKGHDNAWWWDALEERGVVLIQRCKNCQTLRHPPRPMCGECQSIEWDSIESSLQGEVFSHVTLHYPNFPGYEYPNSVAVISLAEGTRIVANVVDIDYRDIKIGMKLVGSVEKVDAKTTLPMFRPA